MKRQLLCCLLVALCVSIARADVPESIKPYLSDQTVGIVRLNIATLDWAGFSGTLIDTLHNAGADDELLAELRTWADGTNQAMGEMITQLRTAGAGELYIVGSFQLMESPILVLVPGARDTAGVVEVMEMLQMESKVVGGLVIAGNDERSIEALTALPAADRSDLLAALDRTADAPVRLAISPGKQLRDIFEQMAARLPAEMGGDPITVLTRGAMSIEASLAAAPDATIQLVIRGESPAAAESLRRWLSARVMELQRELQIDFSSLIPEHQGDTLKLTLDAERRLTLAKAVIPSMLHARETARRVQSASNIRQQLQVLVMWSADNRGAWPTSLEAAAKAFDVVDQVFTNPRYTGAQPHYIYVRPADLMGRTKNPAERLVIYEAHDDFGDGINVGFADGHVEFINDEARFKQLLKTAQDNAAKE